MSLERDEGVAATLLATPPHNAAQSNRINKRRPSECMSLCVTVFVNERGMISSLSRDDSMVVDQPSRPLCRQLGKAAWIKSQRGGGGNGFVGLGENYIGMRKILSSVFVAHLKA